MDERITTPDGPHTLRAIIESYDEANHRADVRPQGAPGALLAGIPVLSSCPGELLAVGAQVAVVAWGDVSGVVLGPIGRPTGGGLPWPPSYQVADNVLRSFSSTTFTSYPNLTLTISHLATSYLWLHVVVNTYGQTGVRGWHHSVAIFVDGVQQYPIAMQGTPNLYCWESLTLSFRTAASYSPGTRSVEVRVRVENAGDEVKCRYSALSALVVPA